LWYSPILFGSEYMRLIKITAKDLEEVKTRGIAKYYVIQFILTVVSFFVLAFIMYSSGSVGGKNGICIGLLIWLGFVATSAIGEMLWEKKSFKLVLIQSLSTLLNLIIAGAIIGAWR